MSADRPTPPGNTTSKPSEEALAALRAQINAVDKELLTLLNRRSRLSLEVGAVKAGTAGPIFRPQREREILDRLTASNPGPLPDDHVRSIWREIFASSRSLQRPAAVAYLGPEGTHSHAAAVNLLGQLMDYRPCKDFREVFSSVHDGQCALGVVPLENALQGSVGQCFDLFMEYDVFIQAEQMERIRHCLLSTETSLAGVHTVYSHPQALAQCQRWLRQHLPAAVLVPCDSTAAAAHRCVGVPGTASIGHSRLSDLLSLPVLAHNLEDEPGNQTRFVVIGPHLLNDGTADKTSVVFTLPDKPGALAEILQVLFQSGINIRKLESRPLRAERWKYAFFADLEVDLTTPTCAAVLSTLRQLCHSFRLVGCYTGGM